METTEQVVTVLQDLNSTKGAELWITHGSTAGDILPSQTIHDITEWPAQLQVTNVSVETDDYIKTGRSFAIGPSHYVNLNTLSASAVASVTSLGLIFTLGVLVNILTIVTISKQNHIRLGSQKILVINLCITNLLFCITMADNIVRSLYKLYFHPIMCTIRAYTVYVSVMTNITNLLLISLNRYFAVVHPHNPNICFRTKRGTIIAIILSWGINIGLYLLPVTGVWGQTGWDETAYKCTIIKAKSNSFNMFTSVVYFIAPIVLEIYCFSHIFVVLRRQNKIFNGTIGNEISSINLPLENSVSYNTEEFKVSALKRREIKLPPQKRLKIKLATNGSHQSKVNPYAKHFAIDHSSTSVGQSSQENHSGCENSSKLSNTASKHQETSAPVDSDFTHQETSAPVDSDFTHQETSAPVDSDFTHQEMSAPVNSDFTHQEMSVTSNMKLSAPANGISAVPTIQEHRTSTPSCIISTHTKCSVPPDNTNKFQESSVHTFPSMLHETSTTTKSIPPLDNKSLSVNAHENVPTTSKYQLPEIRVFPNNRFVLQETPRSVSFQKSNATSYEQSMTPATHKENPASCVLKAAIPATHKENPTSCSAKSVIPATSKDNAAQPKPSKSISSGRFTTALVNHTSNFLMPPPHPHHVKSNLTAKSKSSISPSTSMRVNTRDWKAAYRNKQNRRELVLTMLCLSLILTHAVCYLPYVISTLAKLVGTRFHTVAVFMAYLHIILNPAIYLMGDSRLRRKINIMCRKCCGGCCRSY